MRFEVKTLEELQDAIELVDEDDRICIYAKTLSDPQKFCKVILIFKKNEIFLREFDLTEFKT